MAHEQLRGILDRARACARGHDFEGVLSAMTEAEGELNRAEEQPPEEQPDGSIRPEKQADGSAPDQPGENGPEGKPEGTTDDPEGLGDWVNEGRPEKPEPGEPGPE